MSLVIVTRPADGVAVVELNRPDRRNALNRALLAELHDQLAALAAEAAAGAVRAVVLTGAGPAFCAGLDLHEIGELGLPESDPVADLLSPGVPLIGAINGPAATGGLELALACDLRLGSERAAFADTHARVGVVPGWGLTARLPLAVGQAWARQMSATGSFVGAELGLRIGLLNEVVPHDALLARAVEVAGLAAAADATVLRSIRAMYDATAATGAAAAHALEAAVWEAGAAPPTDLAARRAALLDR